MRKLKSTICAFFLTTLIIYIFSTLVFSKSVFNTNFYDEKIMFSGSPSYGINIHTPFYGDKIKNLGAQWVRWGGGWSEIERQKGVYNFSKLDSIVDNFRINGLKIVFILDLYERNPLYPEYSKDLSNNLLGFTQFVKAISQHFKGKIEIWEIGNEPQGDPAKIYNQPEKYVTAARSIAKVIKKSDSKSHIAALSTAWMDKPFISKCLELGLLKDRTIDVISFHGYHRTTIIPESGLAEDVGWLRQQISAFCPQGMNIVVIDSERGYAIHSFQSPKPSTTFRNIVYSEAEQAAYLARHFLEEIYLGIEVSIWYKDMWGEENFSLYEGGSDSRIRPMGIAMQNIAKALPYNPKDMINSKYTVSVDSIPRSLQEIKSSLKFRSYLVKPTDKDRSEKLVIALWNQVEAFDNKILQSRKLIGDEYHENWRSIKKSDIISIPVKIIIKKNNGRVKNVNKINLFSEKQNAAVRTLEFKILDNHLITESLAISPMPTLLIAEIES